MFKNSVHTSKRTYFTITKINLLTLFKEIIAVTSLQIVKIAGTYNYLSLSFKGLKHNHMALEPKLGPGLPFCVFVTMTFLQGWIISPAPNLEDQASVFMTPEDRVVQLYPQALGTHFSHLLRHAWVTVGLFFNPGHHTGGIKTYVHNNFK
jgi:hypothetical protein